MRSYQVLQPLRPPKCVKGIPCGSVCISKGEKCSVTDRKFYDRPDEYVSNNEREFFDDPNAYARGFQEYTAATLSGFSHPKTGRVDISKFRSLPEAEQRAALKEAYRFIENGLVDGTGIDKNYERMVDSLSHGYGQDFPDGLAYSPIYAKVKRRKDSAEPCECKKCVRKRRRKDSSSLRLDRRVSGTCGRGWVPAPGGGCVRKNRAKAFRRSVWNATKAVAGITAGRIAVRAGTALAMKGYSKAKEAYRKHKEQGKPEALRVRRDAPLRAKCDERHGWTRGNTGKCIRSERRKKFNQGYKAGAATAAILGLTAVGYSAARAKYRANIPKAAAMAVQRAKEIDPKTLPDFKGKEGILLAQPGFTGFAGKTQGAGIEKIMGDGLSAAAGESYGTFMLSNQKFNIFMPDKIPEGWNPKDMSTYRPSGRIEQFIVPTVKRFLKTTIKDGYNEQSVEATAHLLAMEKKFRDQNPGKEPVIKAAGYSAGGMILADSNMQLKHLGKNVEMLFLGSPYFGLADDSKSMTRIVSKNDPVMKLGSSGFKNVHRFNQVRNHIKYQEEPGVQKVVNDWLQKGVARPVPGLRADSRSYFLEVRRRRRLSS